MRTDQEIIDYYGKVKDDDFLGTMGSELISRLPFDSAKPFLKKDADSSKWITLPRDNKSILKEMRDYMEFAWDKATGHRGISAGRSIDHFRAWLFLVGDDELLAFANAEGNYPNYGCPILKKISEKYGFPVPNNDKTKRMSAGKSCGGDSGCGCGQ